MDENRPVGGPYKSVCTLNVFKQRAVRKKRFVRGREPTGWGSVQIGLYVEFFSKRAERSVVPER